MTDGGAFGRLSEVKLGGWVDGVVSLPNLSSCESTSTFWRSVYGDGCVLTGLPTNSVAASSRCAKGGALKVSPSFRPEVKGGLVDSEISAQG